MAEFGSQGMTRREALELIMVDNPRRFLAFVPKRPRRR
jgi:hypothetical protein